jgi:hypothetical protein
LNHKLLGDKAELAYKRDQLTELRREMLEAWVSYLNGPAQVTSAAFATAA